MKSDKNMTDNVLMRVADIKLQKKHQKKIAVKTLSAAFAFIFVFMAGVTVFNDRVTPSVTEVDTIIENTVDKTFSVVVASAAENTEAIEINKEIGVSIPFGGLLYVKDTSNMSRTEINKIVDETQSVLIEHFDERDNWSVTGIEGDIAGDIAVYFASFEYLRLNIADADAVEEITLSCGEYGKLMISDRTLLGNSKQWHKTIRAGKEIAITGEEYECSYAENKGMIIKWQPSEELLKALSENPATPLSQVSDEITGVIRYTDGSEESFTISLSFDDEGILKADYSYNK